MKRLSFLLILIFAVACKNEPKKNITEISPAVSNETKPEIQEKIQIAPISHASMTLNFQGKSFYVDPVGSPEIYQEMGSPNIILLTHAHPDHFDIKILELIANDSTLIVASRSVSEVLPQNLPGKTKILANGESLKIYGINIEAVPMYNIREEARKFHPKGEGNGYILEDSEMRIYIAGDTGPTPEMRKLKNIDIAFVPMNLPYTMSVGEAADAVLDFKPKKVYPYHYRGQNGLSDIEEFKNIINTNNSAIEVIQLDWYPEE